MQNALAEKKTERKCRITFKVKQIFQSKYFREHNNYCIVESFIKCLFI